MIAPDHAQHLRTRILWPLALALGLVLLAAVLGFYRHAQADLQRATRETEFDGARTGRRCEEPQGGVCVERLKLDDARLAPDVRQGSAGAGRQDRQHAGARQVAQQ